MDIVTEYVLYLAITIALTVAVARALGRSGRVFLREVFGGNDALAAAVNRLLIVGFYLLNFGFAALTMRTTATITTSRQLMETLSIKLGELLLIIGVLHVANLFVFTRIRRSAQREPYSDPRG